MSTAPRFQVLRGQPDEAELAALVAVVTAIRAGADPVDAAEPDPVRPGWVASHAEFAQAGSWRAGRAYVW